MSRATDNPNSERRDFLKAGAMAAGLTVGPGVLLYGVAYSRAPEEPASPDKRWGMLIDTTKCGDGCNECVTACNTENGLSGKTGPQDSQWIRKVHIRDLQTGFELNLPMLCQHCENPPCVDVCPTGASMKRADGIVLVDRHTCIGCRYCMMACPYGNRYFNNGPQNYYEAGATAYEEKRVHRHQTNVVMKCNFCRDRVNQGKDPACVANCPAYARFFGDLDDPNSEVSRLIKDRGGFPLHPELGTKPCVYYLPA